MYYHFYHRNLHIASAHGDEEARVMLAQLNTDWRSSHDSFWSDEGGVELSRHRAAPKRNDHNSMLRWRKTHPNW